MAFPASPYIEERHGGLYLEGARISLDTIAIRFQQGQSPESIVESFPTLRLSQVYGAIAYHLENEAAVNEYIAEGEREFQRSVPPLSERTPNCLPAWRRRANRCTRNERDGQLPGG
jgi:uncharacterized protein (DUF433 family)